MAERETYLVTGAAGFIGSHFVRWARKAHPNARIVILDALTYAGSPANLADVLHAAGSDDWVRFVRGSVCDAELVESLLVEEHPRYVVNFAAESSVDRSFGREALFWETNVEGVRTLLAALNRTQTKKAAPPARFLQISTDEVYGSLALDAPGAFNEASPIAPTSPYSQSKAAADELVLAAVRETGLDACITRCSNNYGTHQHGEKLIPRMIGCALAHEPLPVYGSGAQIRDWIFVGDHVRAVDAVLRHGQAGEVYNVGSRTERSNLALVRTIVAICRELTGDARIDESLIAHVADRPAHDQRYAIDPSKLERELGWRAQADFNAALRETVYWYATNRAGI